MKLVPFTQVDDLPFTITQADLRQRRGPPGRAADNDVVLQDDKTGYPIYNIAPVVRANVLQTYPEIADILNRLAPLLTDDVMAGLNYQVDGPDLEQPSEVARAFLEQQGLFRK